MPPIKVHAEAVVKNQTEEIIRVVLAPHNAILHQKDTEQENSTKHHHHCAVISFSDVFIKDELALQFYDFFTPLKRIFHYKKAETSSFLENVFQPPKQY